MNDIDTPQTDVKSFIRRLAQKKLDEGFNYNPAHTVTLITKTQGGVGADTLASILAFLMEEQGIIAPIFQAGGTKGPLCEVFQMPRFQRVPVNNSVGLPLDQQLSQFLIANAGRPAIAVISPEINAIALSVITKIIDAQLPVKFHNIHLIRPPSTSFAMTEKLKPLCVSSVIALIEPLTIRDDFSYDGTLWIPRVPEEIIYTMEEQQLTFKTAFTTAEAPQMYQLVRPLQYFAEDLDKFYKSQGQG